MSSLTLREHPRPTRVVFMSPCWFRGGLETVTMTHIEHMLEFPDEFDITLLVGESDERR